MVLLVTYIKRIPVRDRTMIRDLITATTARSQSLCTR